jgi:hypothetical protein
MAEMEETEAGSRNDISPQSPHIRERPINGYTPPMRRGIGGFLKSRLSPDCLRELKRPVAQESSGFRMARLFPTTFV